MRTFLAVILAAVLLIITFVSQVSEGGGVGLAKALPMPPSPILLGIAVAISLLVLFLALLVIKDHNTSGASRAAVIGSVVGIALAWIKLVGQGLPDGS
jgi:hypothetical protein